MTIAVFRKLCQNHRPRGEQTRPKNVVVLVLRIRVQIWWRVTARDPAGDTRPAYPLACQT